MSKKSLLMDDSGRIATDKEREEYYKKPIEEKFEDWFDGEINDELDYESTKKEILETFKAGYELAMKEFREMRERIIEAEEVIKELTEHSFDEEIAKHYWDRYR